MKVVIIGAGEVGFHVAKALSEENYDITIIDIDIKNVKEQLRTLMLSLLRVMGPVQKYF